MAARRRATRTVRTGRPYTGKEGWSAVAAGWARWEGVMMDYLGGANAPMARALRLAPGMRVLDVGCGIGEPALTFARLVQPTGRVLGVDLAPDMIRMARQRARLRSIANVQFRAVNAERMRGASFDAVTARFGVMFFEDPVAALGRLRALLRPGGRAAFAVWGPIGRHTHMQITHRVVATLRGEPQPDPESGPHPLRYARRGSLERVMRAAGFRDTASEPVRLVMVHPDADAFVRCVTETSPSLVECWHAVPPARRAWAARTLRAGAGRHARDGVVRLPALAWVVSGRR
jgi:enediyne biosynthesis protein CalE5